MTKVICSELKKRQWDEKKKRIKADRQEGSWKLEKKTKENLENAIAE